MVLCEQVRLARRITAEERRAARTRNTGTETADAACQAAGDGAGHVDRQFVQVFAKDTPAAGTSPEVAPQDNSPAEGERFDMATLFRGFCVDRKLCSVPAVQPDPPSSCHSARPSAASQCMAELSEYFVSGCCSQEICPAGSYLYKCRLVPCQAW